MKEKKADKTLKLNEEHLEKVTGGVVYTCSCGQSVVTSGELIRCPTCGKPFVEIPKCPTCGTEMVKTFSSWICPNYCGFKKPTDI